MTYKTRSQTGIAGPTDGHAVSPREKTKFVVHWDGGENPTTAADELRLLKAYARHHIAQGWQGPAYNLAVGPVTGNVYEYRGLSAVGTHAPGANRDGIGCILIGGSGNLTEAGKQGLREAYALANSFAGHKLAQLVHSDVVATQCPGDQIRAWVHGGGLETTTPITTGKEDDMIVHIGGKSGKRHQGLWLLANGTATLLQAGVAHDSATNIPRIPNETAVVALSKQYKGIPV